MLKLCEGAMTTVYFFLIIFLNSSKSWVFRAKRPRMLWAMKRSQLSIDLPVENHMKVQWLLFLNFSKSIIFLVALLKCHICCEANKQPASQINFIWDWDVIFLVEYANFFSLYRKAYHIFFCWKRICIVCPTPPLYVSCMEKLNM